jgi:small-conductance mechanosensitive channel
VLAPSAFASLTLLTAAIGAGLGFGAQNIVKDVLNGIFIVAEDQVGIGDVVDLGLATGIVEFVSVRVTHVRDVNGTLWYVRNGEITRIGNLSQGWSRVIIDLSVATDSDIDEVEKAMLDTAKGLAKDPKWRTRILEQPEVWGLESISGDALVIRLVMKTRANAKDDVARELRMRLKHAIDEMGIDGARGRAARARRQSPEDQADAGHRCAGRRGLEAQAHRQEGLVAGTRR